MLMAQEALAFLAAQERRVLRATEVPRVQGQQGPRGREEAPHGCRVAVLLLHRMEAASAGPGGRKDAWFSWNITMPFSSPMEAELVRRVLSPDATPLPRPGAVLKDFTVSGNLLFIRLTAADHRQLQLSISSCLQQLSLLMWIVQCFLPMFLALLHSEQRR
nr:cancer/testis antigen 1-like isoform X2 [Macaca fascicularis]